MLCKSDSPAGHGGYLLTLCVACFATGSEWDCVVDFSGFSGSLGQSS